MAEEEKITEAADNAEEPYKKEPKENYVIYTIISVFLFCVIVFVYKMIAGNILRDYRMITPREMLTDEATDYLKDYTGIDFGDISEIRLLKQGSGKSAVICYRNIGSVEDFADNYIMYEYGDVIEDIRIEIYPYGNSVSEYAFASSYVSIDDPDKLCYVYEFDGNSYAEFHSGKVTPEFSSLFSGAEKIYE